jgi:hypothetical protein
LDDSDIEEEEAVKCEDEIVLSKEGSIKNITDS